jgi:hypothetical protein
MCLFGHVSRRSLRGALFIYHTTADWFNKLEELGVSDRTDFDLFIDFGILYRNNAAVENLAD